MEKVSSSGWSSALAGGADTIVARTTPAGRGGLAVVRLSGAATRAIVSEICPEVDLDQGWRASLVRIRGRDREEIDRAVALPYPAPRSYTGEDMLELMVHGSPFIVTSVIDALLAAGARQAEPGEFTRRAVANGKMDLVQAEAVNELASAETAWQARQAQAQLSGLLSQEFATLRATLLELLAQLEGALDFGHHEIPYDREGATAGRDECLEHVRRLLATAAAGNRIRDGLRVVILGPPNSGKSTLFNRLARHDRAIVSPHAGTTRDVVESQLEVAGVRVVLLDTAGLGSTADPVEREGVRRAHGAAADADVVLLLWPVDGEGEATEVPVSGVPVLRVRSKWDLAEGRGCEKGWLALSCRSGEGVEKLRAALVDLVSQGVEDLGGRVAISNRHFRSLTLAAAELERAEMELPEVAAEAVRGALQAARELLGEVVTEDVLDRIFSDFCIGK